MISQSFLLEALKSLILPEEGTIQSLDIQPSGKVTVIVELTSSALPHASSLKKKMEKALRDIPGVTDVYITLTATRSSNRSQAPKIKGISYIIAVASGKGGVGKSTTAVNLAAALKLSGKRVGILDADIYGPSFPKLLGIREKPTSPDGKTMDPPEIYGLKTMSIGFLIEENTPAIWRGPMAQKALLQMVHQVNWGDLDILIVDLPPGTGDIQLSLAQNVSLSGALIVSTPQDLALTDARKALEMFRKVDIPVLGLIENMSYFLCPHCTERSDIFNHGGVREESRALDIPFLGEIPLHMAIQRAADTGIPLPFQESKSESEVYHTIADHIWEVLSRPPAG